MSFHYAQVFSLRPFKPDSFRHLGPIGRLMGVLAVVEGRKMTESEGWASQSLLHRCVQSSDMPYSFSGHCSQDQEEAGWAPGQPDEVGNWSGSRGVHRHGGSWAGPGGLCGATSWSKVTVGGGS